MQSNNVIYEYNQTSHNPNNDTHTNIFYLMLVLIEAHQALQHIPN